MGRRCVKEWRRVLTVLELLEQVLKVRAMSLVWLECGTTCDLARDGPRFEAITKKLASLRFRKIVMHSLMNGKSRQSRHARKRFQDA
jgi:hypothetical protein